MNQDDWTVICNLWGAVVGNSGVMKSPTLGAVLSPIGKLAAVAFEAYSKAKAAHDEITEIAKLQQAADAAPAGPAEFTPDLPATGQIALRGPLTNALTQNATQAFAEARFGLGHVYQATRLDAGLPDG